MKCTSGTLWLSMTEKGGKVNRYYEPRIFFFILGGIIAAVFNGNIDVITTAAMSSASDAVQRAITP